MIRTTLAGADCLLFAAEPNPKPLKLLMLVGSDSPQGNSPFGHSAIEPYRVINPAKALTRSGVTTAAVKVHLIDPRREPALWEWADVISYVRAWPLSPSILEERLDWCHKREKAMVLDLDDYWLVPEDNPAKPFYDRVVVPLIDSCLPRFDRVICATEPLAEKVRPYNKNVITVPNTIDPADWRVTTPRRIPGLTVGVQGGGTHYHDWRVLGDVWPVLAERYPDLTFVVAGYLPDYLRPLGDRLVTLPYVPLKDFPCSVAEIDIACCPLLDSEWARCKSPIKWLESAILGKAVVASPTVYGENRETALCLAGTPEQWLKHLSDLIEHPEYRAIIGRHAAKQAIEQFSVDALAERWAEAYRGVVEGWCTSNTRQT